MIQNVTGLFAGGIIYAILTRHPGPAGYGRLHLIAFGFLVLSYIIFALIREIPLPEPPAGTPAGLWQN